MVEYKIKTVSDEIKSVIEEELGGLRWVEGGLRGVTIAMKQLFAEGQSEGCIMAIYRVGQYL